MPTEETGGIEEVAAYIREHYADPELSISAIAEAFGVSTARLSLSFKERNRVSPNEYLAILRVERSKQLLTETELSIKEIAVNVGYYDASSFFAAFKQNYRGHAAAVPPQQGGHKPWKRRLTCAA